MRSTLKNYAGLKVRCPELADLELRLKNLLATAS